MAWTPWDEWSWKTKVATQLVFAHSTIPTSLNRWAPYTERWKRLGGPHGRLVLCVTTRAALMDICTTRWPDEYTFLIVTFFGKHGYEHIFDVHLVCDSDGDGRSWNQEAMPECDVARPKHKVVAQVSWLVTWYSSLIAWWFSTRSRVYSSPSLVAGLLSLSNGSNGATGADIY